MVSCHVPVEEADIADEEGVGVEPDFSRDPQPAADLVELVPFQLHGSVVRRHAICHAFPVDLPGHLYVVGVESAGHADDGLLPHFIFVVATFLWRRREKRDLWFCYHRIWVWTDVTKAGQQPVALLRSFSPLLTPRHPASVHRTPLTYQHVSSTFTRGDEQTFTFENQIFPFLTENCQSGAAAEVRWLIVITLTQAHRKNCPAPLG